MGKEYKTYKSVKEIRDMAANVHDALEAPDADVLWEVTHACEEYVKRHPDDPKGFDTLLAEIENDEGGHLNPARVTEMRLGSFDHLCKTEGYEEHIVLAARYKKDGSPAEIVRFDAGGKPEAAAARALAFGVQNGYTSVGVGTPFYMTACGEPMPYWSVENGNFSAYDDRYTDTEWRDKAVERRYNDLIEKGTKVPAPEDIYRHLHDPYVAPEGDVAPAEYEMYTKDLSHRDFYQLEKKAAQFADELAAKGKMDEDMQNAWLRCGANDNNIAGHMIFTSEYLHTMPESYQPKSLVVTHGPEYAHHGAQAVINGELVEKRWHFDHKGEREFGAPSDEELAGKLVETYLIDKIARMHDGNAGSGYSLVTDRRGRERVVGNMEIDGEKKQVSFSRTYGDYTLDDADIKSLLDGGSITVPIRSGQASVKLGDGKYMGHPYFGLQRTDLPKRKLPDVAMPEDGSLENEAGSEAPDSPGLDS